MSFKCFAYGSNMFTPKMRVSAPSTEVSVIGKLLGYVLRFNKMSDDGSAKGNIVVSGNVSDVVWGVIFEVDERHRVPLDRSEGGYGRIVVEALTVDGPLPTSTYIARAGRVDETLKPYTWYKQFVVRGAYDHGLPSAYIEGLEGVEAIEDHDEERNQRNLALLASSYL